MDDHVSITKDWSGWGDKLGLEGKTMKIFLTMLL